MKYDAVIFDMDGTVLDTLSDLSDSVNYSLSRFSMPEIPAWKVRASLGNGAAHLIRSCVPEGTSEEIISQLLSFYMDYYKSHCCIKTAPYEGIIPLMEALRSRGVKLAIISNKPDDAVRELANRFFPGMTELAVGESEGVRRKPHPDSVLAAAENLGIVLERCVYVGDSEVDVETARRAGIDCISVTWGFRDTDELLAANAAVIAENISQLSDLLMGDRAI